MQLGHAELSDQGVGLLHWKANWISSLRHALAAAVQSAHPDLDRAGVVDGLRLPGIVHTTILRWRDAPGAHAEELRQGFERAVQLAIKESKSNDEQFGLQLEIACVRIVAEGRPFMRDAVVLAEFEL